MSVSCFLMVETTRQSLDLLVPREAGSDGHSQQQAESQQAAQEGHQVGCETRTSSGGRRHVQRAVEPQAGARRGVAALQEARRLGRTLAEGFSRTVCGAACRPLQCVRDFLQLRKT